jgi:hypothetical protein
MMVLEEENLGQGLMLGRFGIAEGTFIGEYTGKIRSNNFNLKARPPIYMYRLTKRYIIDAKDSPNVLKFINHSCDPNLRTEKWYYKGKQVLVRVRYSNSILTVHTFFKLLVGIPMILLFAKKDIQPFTWLSTSYGDNAEDLFINKTCLCKKCPTKSDGQMLMPDMYTPLSPIFK